MNEKLLQSPAEARQVSRPLLLWISVPVLAVLLVHLGSRLVNDPTALGLADFIQYWSAGYLSTHGGDPYSVDELAQVQGDLGWRRDDGQVADNGLPLPVIMYCPPLTLPLVAPFGLLPYGASRLLWLVLHLGLCLFCADVLWRHYGGPARYRWVAWTLAFSFLPTLIVLKIGQIAPLILLGVVGFLYFQQRRWDGLAGGALVLLAIKPQLAYLVAPALVLWAVQYRRWSALGGAVVAGLACTGLALLLDPHALQGYRDLMVYHSPRQNKSPALGTVLRLLAGEELFWLQFVPTALGLAWFAYHWWRHRQAWDWSEQMPLLLLVSFLTTAYGAWSFDLVVLLVPITQAAAWLWHNPRRRLVAGTVAGYIAMNLLALAINLLGVEYIWFLWMTPVLLGGYLILRAQPAL